MTPTFNDKLLAYLVLFSGLAISGVAEYYSIMGLIAIYPAAVWPIVIMGIVLGFGKISATVWLKQNWQFAPWFLKAYILPAITVLMIITSLGVFGFLSKAHSDQSLVSGDVQAKIAVYDEKIKTAKDNIDANRKALKQMDEAVDQSMARSNDEKGADKAVAIRRGQQKERQRLQAEIATEQKAISQLSEERAPIAAEVRQVEAEVGPIKYIAHLLYGDNPDANILEKAVIWVTVLIVIVLDPLAVILLLAAQYSFMRFRQLEDIIPEKEPVTIVEVASPATPSAEAVNEDYFVDIDKVNLELQEAVEPPEVIVPEPANTFRFNDGGEHPRDSYGYEEPVEEVAEERPSEVVGDTLEVEQEDYEIIDSATFSEAEAMTQWKQDHPDSSLKLQRRLLELGKIDHLPWEDYVAAAEAAKWAEENPQAEEAQEAKDWADEHTRDLERPGDYITPPDVSYMENIDGQQVKKPVEGYQQNAEQSSVTLWQRVKKAKGDE